RAASSFVRNNVSSTAQHGTSGAAPGVRSIPAGCWAPTPSGGSAARSRASPLLRSAGVSQRPPHARPPDGTQLGSPSAGGAPAESTGCNRDGRKPPAARAGSPPLPRGEGSKTKDKTRPPASPALAPARLASLGARPHRLLPAHARPLRSRDRRGRGGRRARGAASVRVRAGGAVGGGGSIMASMQKRLQKELLALQNDPPPGMTLNEKSVQNSITQWIVDMEGAPGTLYEGEKFQLLFKFSSRYPFDSPQVMFTGDNIPVHPHVYSNGHICLSILTEDWSPALSVQSVCLSIISMLSSCKEKRRPPDNSFYVRTCNKNPKKTKWWYHGRCSSTCKAIWIWVNGTTNEELPIIPSCGEN
uniref:N-terminal E2 ubiquitin-conjugating enzyme n=1 Tax=Gallus gallus TaxID=9031 RepID=A0A8V0XAU5_CHICK